MTHLLFNIQFLQWVLVVNILLVHFLQEILKVTKQVLLLVFITTAVDSATVTERGLTASLSFGEEGINWRVVGLGLDHHAALQV